MAAFLARILRYPVKALSAEDMDATWLSPGRPLPGDRRYALALADTALPDQPQWLPRERLLNLSRFPRLAQLETTMDGEILTIRRRGKVVLHTDLRSPPGQAVVSAFFAAFLAGASFGHPHVVECPEGGFGDDRRPRLSLVGAATLDELERIGHRGLGMADLRMNLLIDGIAPREEQRWQGCRLQVGKAMLALGEPIERDVLPEVLRSTFGHRTLGIWGDVVEGGDIRLGDRVHPRLPAENRDASDEAAAH